MENDEHLSGTDNAVPSMSPLQIESVSNYIKDTLGIEIQNLKQKQNYSKFSPAL